MFKIPLVNKSFILFPQWRIDRFQSLAVSLPEMYWNSLGVIQASWNQMQGPLEPWQSLDKYIKAVFVPHSISSTTSSSRTCNEICLAYAFWNQCCQFQKLCQKIPWNRMPKKSDVIQHFCPCEYLLIGVCIQKRSVVKENLAVATLIYRLNVVDRLTSFIWISFPLTKS